MAKLLTVRATIAVIITIMALLCRMRKLKQLENE